MKPKVPTHFPRQKGLSLIGLLIGLLISVLCILGSLTLYKNLIQVATESKLDSNHDGQLASTMLVMQLEVQSAGYGIETPAADSIAVHTPATGETQLLWRFSPDEGTTFECRGLYEKASNSGLFRQLSLIQVESGCDSATALSSLTWDVDDPIAVLGKWRVVDDEVDDIGLDDYIADHGTMFDFFLTTEVCNPFGASGVATETHGYLEVTVPGSAFLQGAADMTATKYRYCLPNIRPAPSP